VVGGFPYRAGLEIARLGCERGFVQIIEVTDIGVRGAVNTLRRAGTRCDSQLYPMIHLGRREFYAEVGRKPADVLWSWPKANASPGRGVATASCAGIDAGGRRSPWLLPKVPADKIYCVRRSAQAPFTALSECVIWGTTGSLTCGTLPGVSRGIA
jgi:hypothetical protein